jgi:hypothetical protein
LLVEGSEHVGGGPCGGEHPGGDAGNPLVECGDGDPGRGADQFFEPGLLGQPAVLRAEGDGGDLGGFGWLAGRGEGFEVDHDEGDGSQPCQQRGRGVHVRSLPGG